jgi:hypothetical protein
MHKNDIDFHMTHHYFEGLYAAFGRAKSAPCIRNGTLIEIPRAKWWLYRKQYIRVFVNPSKP